MEPMVEESSPRPLIGWVIYDWANSAFATTVMAGFFPLFFKQYWSPELSVVESTYYLGLINSVTSFVLAALSPALGAIADVGSFRKRFLFWFTLLGVLSTAALAFLESGQWQIAAWFYSLALLGFIGANTFYDALLVQVARPKNYDKVSALGYSMGYLGGGVLFAINVWMYTSPKSFGLSDGVEAVKFSFLTVAIWWSLFSLPIFFWTPESKSKNRISIFKATQSGVKSLLNTLRDLRQHKGILYFLIGYIFYIDGVNTIIKMSVDYGMSIGLQPSDLIKALLLVQFVGFPSAIAFGYLGAKMGAKFGIGVCLVVYAGVTAFAYQITTGLEFYILAIVIGLVQGGIQSLSRSYYARLVPTGQSAEYFGFYNMLGKFSSILGPLLMGAVAVQTNNPRASILVLLLFFLVGGILLGMSHQEKKA